MKDIQGVMDDVVLVYIKNLNGKDSGLRWSRRAWAELNPKRVPIVRTVLIILRGVLRGES